MPTIIRISRGGQPEKPDPKSGLPYYPLVAARLPSPVFLNPSLARAGLPESEPDLVVSLHAAALNHRDLFIRQKLYPAISDKAALCGDGAGIVREVVPAAGSSGPSDGNVAANYSSLKGERVVICPGFNWLSRRLGPEAYPASLAPFPYVIMGGTAGSPFHGTLGTSIRVPASYVVPAPAHLSAAEAASLPIAGLTAWRAVVTKLQDVEADAAAEMPARKLRILITGIGGGVALFALQFAVARGHEVWVTSSSDHKIDRAVKLGATGGEKYTAKGWEKTLLDQLAKHERKEKGSDTVGSPPEFDALIDSAGGPGFVRSAARLLCHGGVIVQYGLTVGPHSVTWDMSAVLKNIELRGCTMGSAREFRDMIEFVGRERVVPVVGEVVHVMGNGSGTGTAGDTDTDEGGEGEEKRVGDALEKAIPQIDGLFETMKRGAQFGKLVVQIREPGKWAGTAGDHSRL